MTAHASILEMSRARLRQTLAERGHKAFRADQLAGWIFDKGVIDPAAMTNLPESLAREFPAATSHVVEIAEAPDATVKLLIEYPDGQRVESVLIPGKNRITACLSTQIGCALGCTFCASGESGLARNLSAAEILEQVVHLRAAAAERINHVVFMGMGEPLANYDATVDAIRALIDPERFGLSARNITVSTIGLPKQIRRLADEQLPITLAVSLHASNDALRKRLMPGVRHGIEDVLGAADYFFEARKREVTLEYLLIESINDSLSDADALADLAHRIRSNVNLIALNPWPGCPYNRPKDSDIKRFAQRLQDRAVNVHLRHSRGAARQAACGQLSRHCLANGTDDHR